MAKVSLCQKSPCQKQQVCPVSKFSTFQNYKLQENKLIQEFGQKMDKFFQIMFNQKSVFLLN